MGGHHPDHEERFHLTRLVVMSTDPAEHAVRPLMAVELGHLQRTAVILAEERR
jgi:hypothetical protein